MRLSAPAGGAILAVALAVVLFLPVILPFLRLLQHRVADQAVALLSPAASAHPDIVFIGVTEETLAKMRYRSPIDRAELAGWVEQLLDNGARAVVLDILFDQPTEPEKDARLARVLAAAEAPVIVAWGGAELTESQAAFQESYLPRSVIRAQPELVRDGAGVVRWIPAPVEPSAGAPRLAMAAATAEALGTPAPAAQLEVAYLGNARQQEPAFRAYVAHAIRFTPLLDAAWVEGDVAVIGVDLPLDDRHRTPFSVAGGAAETMPGALIHAHALAQILDGREAPHAGLATRLAVALALCLTGIGIALMDRPLALKAAVALLGVVLFGLAAVSLFQRAGVLIEPVMPTLGLAVAFALTGAHSSRQQLLEKRAIRDTFGLFVAPAVVRQLEAEPERLRLGGESLELTYVFTDIAGFASLSEKIEPAELVRVLNDYLDGMTRIILEHRGTIDKFIGDATVSLFNAPEPQPDHARRAVDCALALDGFATAFAERQRKDGVSFGGTRLGVHTGQAVIGNFGGRQRFDYTAVGDTVNTASRLEGANKYLGTRICVSGATVAQCDAADFRPAGRLVLKGRTEALAVFEPLAVVAGGAEAAARYAAVYDLMDEDGEAALAAFREFAESYPADPLAAFHRRRLEGGERGTRIVLEGK